MVMQICENAELWNCELERLLRANICPQVAHDGRNYLNDTCGTLDLILYHGVILNYLDWLTIISNLNSLSNKSSRWGIPSGRQQEL